MSVKTPMIVLHLNLKTLKKKKVKRLINKIRLAYPSCNVIALDTNESIEILDVPSSDSL